MNPSSPLPPRDRAQLLEKSMALLGWNLVARSLASLALSPFTHEKCLALAPETDFALANRLLDETAEMVSLLDSTESPPMEVFDDIRPVLDEARERILIEPRDALRVMKVLRFARSLSRYIDKRSAVPLLKTKIARLNPLPALLKELERCIDEDGEIKENASPELRQAIRDAWAAKEKLDGVVGKMLSDSAYSEALQDGYHTEREGRVVLPIKAEWRSRVDGIVHDTSGSGVTIYMEPTKIIPLNNQLKINRLRIEREKLKILGQLAGEFIAHETALLGDLEVLSDFDLVYAKARLARTMGARKCPATPDSRVDLRQARNPELILNGREVVPNDIGWDPAIRVIVVSGPNTGGKTVTLKTLGLMSLMVRAGLFLPVREDSAIGFFPEAYADIGDDQNIQLNLSTFSAHLQKIVNILENAAPGALILLDELGIATDPREGAALAESILKEMKRKGLTTVVSTHYLSLKILAQTEEGFLNACTEFDSRSLTPTYRLVFGVPGNSAALDTAERLGLPSRIIQLARQIHGEKDSQANVLLQKLNQQLLESAREREELERKNEEIGKLREEQALIAQRMRAEMEDFHKSKAKQLQAIVREGKQEIRRMLEELEANKTPANLRKAQGRIQEMTRVPLPDSARDTEGWDVPADRLADGDPVMVEGYGAKGVLLEDPKGKKKVRVRLGGMVTVVETQKLRGSSRPVQSRPAPQAKVTVEVESGSRPRNSCDLRGMRWEEAQSVVETFVNQAVVNRVGRIKIVHGHGMGALKKLVRDYLETSGLGKSYQPGTREEGGDGVTIVEL